MGRHSTVATHPQRTRIDTMLDDGIPYSTIARDMSLALASVGRYALSRKSELAKIVASEPGVTEILTRLLNAADHAQQLRRQSKLTGSPVAQARAIKTESELLSKLIGELGIDDARVGEFVEEAQALAMAVKVFFRTYPESAADLLSILSKTPDTQQIAQALRAQMEK